MLMKKLWSFFFFGGILMGMYAQTLNDVYQYNRTDLNGTARYTATAGTITQMGGDLSAVSDNPAAATGFVANRLSWTPGIFNTSNTAIYNNEAEYSGTSSIFNAPFYTQQWGLVFPFVSSKQKWNKIVAGINGRAEMQYIDRVEMKGTAPVMQSVADYFVYQAEGVPTADLEIYEGETFEGVYQWLGETYGTYAQQAFLAYHGYVIDPATSDSLNTAYVSNATFSAPLQHTLTHIREGKKFTHDIFFAAQYDKKISVGISIAMKDMRYTDNRLFTEEGYDPQSTLQYVEYETTLKTKGSGYLFKLGMRYDITPDIKVSFAYQSPTWWELKEVTTEGLYTEALDRDDLDNDGNTDELNIFELYPGIENEFEKYRYLEPGQLMAGFSYRYRKYGFVALDYTYRNWAMTHFSAKNGSAYSQAYFDDLNESIRETFTAQHRYRAGGEVHMHEWSLRAGIFHLTSPYKNYADYTTQGYTFGMGYDFGNIELDLSLYHSKTNYPEQLFPAGLTASYEVHSVQNRYNLTLRFNF